MARSLARASRCLFGFAGGFRPSERSGCVIPLMSLSLGVVWSLCVHEQHRFEPLAACSSVYPGWWLGSTVCCLARPVAVDDASCRLVVHARGVSLRSVAARGSLWILVGRVGGMSTSLRNPPTPCEKARHRRVEPLNPVRSVKLAWPCVNASIVIGRMGSCYLGRLTAAARSCVERNSFRVGFGRPSNVYDETASGADAAARA